MSDREKFEAWHDSDIPQFNGELKYSDVNMGPFDGWQACAESMQAEIDKRDARVAQLEEALNEILGSPSYLSDDIANAALSTSASTWLADKIKEADVKVLEELFSNSHDATEAYENILDSRIWK